MVSRAAVEVLKKAAEHKERAGMLQKNGTNIEINPAQIELQKIYHDVLILDLEYALDEKVEQDLWNICFKNHIVSLQNLAKDKKNNGSHYQSKLLWFLDCASGFYLALLQEICTVFDLDLPFRRKDRMIGIPKRLNKGKSVNKPSTPSCYYICQYCLVHLGDIARYRSQIVHAESFYRHAVNLCATSGHPYNQLAFLEATRYEPLSTVFYFTRSIAVKCQFPAAKTNLSNTLLRWTKIELPADGTKSVSDYEGAFLQFYALLYVANDAPGARRVLQSLTHALTPLVATQEISSWKLLQMAVITIFMFTQSEGKSPEIQQTLLEYLSGYLNSLLVPVYTISHDSILQYFGLPPIKIVLNWFKCDPRLVPLMNKPHIWKSLCKLLNLLRQCNPVAPVNYALAALPEDNDLQGFSPLDHALSELTYSTEKMNEDVALKVRAHRILKLGEWLAKNADFKPISMGENKSFEVVPFEMVIPITPTSPDAPASAPKPQKPLGSDNWKAKGRQNAFLQSLHKKSQSLANENLSDPGMKLEWNDQPPGDWWPNSPDDARRGENAWQASNKKQKNKSPRFSLPQSQQRRMIDATKQQRKNNPGGENFGMWAVKNLDVSPISNQEGTYSLFSGTDHQHPVSSNAVHSNGTAINHQSLWSGPGPSPLERLLEQQKQLRNTMQFDT